MIDWTNRKEKISKYFTVEEALLLPRWNILHIPSETEILNILAMAEKMDLIREYIEMPIFVLCWLRPNSINCPDSQYHGKDYNGLIGGAPESMHIYGSAVDWYSKENCDSLRYKIQFMLDEWKLRMERLPNSNWIHVDNKDVSEHGQRYYIPY